MITAKEARARVEELDTAFLKEEKEEVERKIEVAINMRQMYCNIDKRIADETTAWLEAKPLNYKVERTSFRGESTTTIRW